MDVSAHFLSRFSRPEHADHRDFGPLRSVQEVRVFAQLGVISGWRGLILVDAVQPQAEDVLHLGLDAVVESPRRAAERESRLSFFWNIQKHATGK